MKNKNHKYKFILLGAGILVLLILIETGLQMGLGRFAGDVTSTHRNSVSSESEPYTILTIGDAFTIGIEEQVNYPMYLQKRLSESNPGKFSLVNGGVLDANSAIVLRQLQHIFRKYQVDAVVLLVGADNGHNLVVPESGNWQEKLSGLKIYQLLRNSLFPPKKVRLRPENIVISDDSEIDEYGVIHSGPRCEQIEKSILNSRRGISWQMVRYFNLGECFLKTKEYVKAERLYKTLILNDTQLEFAYSGLRRLYDAQGKFDEVEKLFQPMLNDPDAPVWAYLELATSYLYQQLDDKALDLYNRALELGANQGLVYGALGDYHFLHEDYGQAEKMYKKALVLRSDGEVLNWLAWISYRKKNLIDSLRYTLKAIRSSTEDWDYYSNLVKFFRLQKHYKHRDIHLQLEKMPEYNPELESNRNFQQYLNFFADEAEALKKIDRRFKSDLRKIFRLCQENGVRLIVQNYPYPYQEVNGQLAAFARKYSLTYINQYEHFRKYEDQSRFFAHVDLCTEECHRLMAENVYAVIQSSN